MKNPPDVTPALDNPSGEVMRGAVYATLLLTVVNAFNYMDRMVLAILAEPIKQDLNLSDSQLGLLTGFAFVALYAAVGLPLARLADRIGRRAVLTASLAIWSLMTAASGFAGSFIQLALARLGVGVGEAGGMPSSHALLAEIFPAHRRAVPIAIMTGGASIGISTGLALGGYLAGTYGWRVAFIVVGLPGLLLAFVVALTLPEPRRPSGPAAPQAPFAGTVARLFRIPTYRWLVMTHPFYSFVTVGLVGWLPPFFIRTHHMSVQTVGPIFGIAYGFGVVFGGIAGTWIMQGVSKDSVKRLLFLAGCLMLAAFPLFVAAMLMPNEWAAIAMLMIFGAMAGGAGAPMIAGQQGVVGRDSRAVGSALSMFVSAYLGAGLGPLLVGMGSDALAPMFGADSLRWALLIASLAIIPPGFFLMMASRRFEADAAD